MDMRHRQMALAVTATTLIIVGESNGFWQDDSVIDAFIANLFTLLWLFSVLGYAKRFLSFESAALRYLRDASYPVYILHQTIIIVMAYFIVQLDWHWALKYGVIVLLTFAFSYALYHGVISRFNVLRLAFGLHAKPAQLTPAAMPQSDPVAKP